MQVQIDHLQVGPSLGVAWALPTTGVMVYVIVHVMVEADSVKSSPHLTGTVQKWVHHCAKKYRSRL